MDPLTLEFVEAAYETCITRKHRTDGPVTLNELVDQAERHWCTYRDARIVEWATRMEKQRLLEPRSDEQIELWVERIYDWLCHRADCMWEVPLYEHDDYYEEHVDEIRQEQMQFACWALSVTAWIVWEWNDLVHDGGFESCKQEIAGWLRDRLEADEKIVRIVTRTGGVVEQTKLFA